MIRKAISHDSASIFDDQSWVAKLACEPTTLDRLNGTIDFERFRPLLEAPFRKAKRGKGGRPAFDVVFMFKVLLLQRRHDLSDDVVESQICDRFRACSR